MAEKDKTRQIYDTLKGGGADVGTYQQFFNWFYARGTQGYQNRKKVWDAFRQDGADVGKNYEEFAGWLNLHPTSQPTAKAAPARKAAGTATGQWKMPANFVENAMQSPQYNPGAYNPRNTYGTRKKMQPQQPKFHAPGYETDKDKKRQERVMRLRKDQLDYIQATGKPLENPIDIGMQRDENGNVVTAPLYAPSLERDGNGNVVSGENGEPIIGMDTDNDAREAYRTSLQDKVEADKSREELKRQLEEAYKTRDELDEKLRARRNELEDTPWWQKMLAEMGKAAHSGIDPNATANDPEHMGYENDEEYMQLMSAARKNHQTIQTLEDKRDGKMDNFWHALNTTATNGYTFNDGLPEMRDVTALNNAKKHIDAINRKRQKGLPLTREEQVAEAVLKANETDDTVQSHYGADYGKWSRDGGMMANSIDFMKDFLLFPGGEGMAKAIAGKIAGVGGKILAKAAGDSALKATAKMIARATLKATGVLVGAHATGAVISNTTAMGRTAALMGQKAAGNVTQDEKGNYKIEDEQGLMQALASAEREQMRENGSEMAGAFLPGGKLIGGIVKRGLERIGLSKVSNFLTQMGGKEWYKRYSQFLKTGGYNGIPGEAFEEYEGELFDALTGHADDAWKDFTDAKQNTDIWLGCATMGALMGAIPMGLHMGGYYKFRHDMNKADKVAAFRLTKEKWEPLKEELDNTDNSSMANVVTERILMNNDLNPQEKKAALEYVRGLTSFRGFNIAQVSNAGDEESQRNQAQNAAYATGYETTDPAAMNDVKNRAAEAQQKLDDIFGEHTDANQILNAKNEDGTSYFSANDRKTAQDVVDAQTEWEGMLQRVRDDIDDEAQQAGLLVDSRTNPTTGMIHSATLKVKNADGTDRRVYITSGNVATMDDGTIDNRKSDPSIVVVDENGKMQMVSPDQIHSVEAPIDAAQAKQEAIGSITQTKAQEAADRIDGLSPKQNPQQSDEVWVKDENDEPVHGVITQVDPMTGQYMVQTDQSVRGKTIQPFLADQLYDMAMPSEQEVEIGQSVEPMQPNGQEQTKVSEQPTNPPINAESTQSAAEDKPTGSDDVPHGKRAIDRIPSEKQTDKQGNVRTVHHWEQADPGDTYDALAEQYEDEQRTEHKIGNRIDKIDKQIKDVDKQLKRLDDSDDFDADINDADGYKTLLAQKRQLEMQKKYWQQVQRVPSDRKAEEARKRDEAERAEREARKAEEERKKAEEEENARREREALNGVPDWGEDTPKDARARGFRRSAGHKYDRQQPVEHVQGKQVRVKFADKVAQDGHVGLMEAEQVQPSHQNGQPNVMHFLPEAQPKKRTDTASMMSADDIAGNINPEEITSSVIAYTGAPSVNARGETIQGNNRLAALRTMWESHPEQGEKYKRYLMDHAADFGLERGDIEKMRHPVLVNVLDVNDDEAIRLGQYDDKDITSGGVERIKPKNAVQRIGKDMNTFANMLLRSSDDEASFSQLVDRNGGDVLKWMQQKGYITPTQLQSAFDSKGNVTAEASNDLKGILYQSIFTGGSERLEEVFNRLPAKAQRAILATGFRDYNSPQGERMVVEIQNSIMAFGELMHDDAFSNATNFKDARRAIEMWKRQYQLDDVTGESFLPTEKYSNFALHLAAMYKGNTQGLIQATFNQLYDLIQGTQEADLLNMDTLDNTPRTLAEAIKETLNIDYNGKQRSNVLAGNDPASQEGKQGGPGESEAGGGTEAGNGNAGSRGGTGVSGNERGRQGDISDSERRQHSAVAEKTVDAPLSEETNEFDLPFVLSSNGTTTFGNVDKESGLKAAPIKLSLGENTVDENGANHGYGLVHIEAGHGQQIRNAGFNSVEEFVETVARNYDTIKEGGTIAGNQTYLLEVSDEHNNTLFIQLSRDGSYWNVNSAGIFKKKYSRRKKEVFTRPALGPRTNTDSGGVDSGLSKSVTAPAGNSPQSSAAKIAKTSEKGDKKSKKVAEGEENKGAVRTADGGYSKLPTNYAYRKTDAQELQDVLDNGMFRKMPDNKIVPGSDKAYTSKSGRTFSFGKQGGNSHGGKAFAAGMPWGDDGNGGTTSGGFTGESYYIAIPGNNVDGWRVGHHGHYSEPQPFDEIEAGKGLWLPFDEDGDVDLSTKGMRVFRKVGDTYYEVEHPEELFKERPIGSTSASEKVETERQGVNTEPSEKQKEAGNYKKGHIKVDGYDITIENPKGSTRSGKDASGKAWSVPMHYDYGYIRGTEGVDGDHIDVYLSDNPTQGNVYVVDQVNQKDGSFDEHKVMYGFPSMEAAVEAYKGQYEKGWKVGTVTEVSREDFKKWMESSHRKTKPFSEYKSVKEAAAEQRPTGEPKRVSAKEAALRDGLRDVMRVAGIEVIDDEKEGQRVLDMANDAQMSESKKRALETASPNLNGTDHQTVVSSTLGAKVIKDLDNLVNEYEFNKGNKPNTFIGDLSRALGAQKHGSNSEYATFETKNGRVVTIRLANHNAKVSTFDNHNESDGISIVITANNNSKLTNDGNAHVTEFYYNALKLRRAEGKPLADIVRSIKQALYSGEFKDTTGLAERQEVNAGDLARQQKVYHGSGAADKVRFFRTANGEAYGFTVGGKIYIDPRISTSETPIHEYAHLWAEALRKANPKEWANVVELMKGCKIVWEQVKKVYPELETDDEIADEVLAHYSGKRGAERLRAEAAKAADEARGVLGKAEVVNSFTRLKEAIKSAWKHFAQDVLHIHFTNAEEVADKVMYDLLNKVNPNTFNLSKPVEEGKDLIAVHNLTEDKLKQSLELGGFPMPSIAITKTSMGHAGYGDISLLFGKDTINPSDRRNKVYSGDAWTPTFPQVSYKLDEKKLDDIYSRALKVGNLPFFKSIRLEPGNLRDRIDGKDPAEIIESSKKDYGMKQMFLTEKGNPVKEYVQKTVDKYSPEKVEFLQQILDKIGVEGLRSGKRDDELKQIVGSHLHKDLDSVKPNFAKIKVQSALRDAIDFAENGNKKVEYDVEATQKEIDSRTDPKEYDQWLHEMFDGIIEKKGIRNNTDPYTRSGDRRKWERLYDAVTLDNVLKAMKAQPAKSGSFFSSIFGASAKELSNLNEVREEAKRRIKSVPEEEFKAEKDKILSRLEKISLPSVESSKSISSAMDFVENVKDAVVHSHTPKDIYKYLSDFYPDMTMEVANEIAGVVKDIQAMSTRYLEAKPYRAVGFDEVRAAVVPSDTDAKIVQQLKDKGIAVYSYERGNTEERRQVVNDAAQEQNAKFYKAESGNSKKAAENEVEAVNKRFNEELDAFKNKTSKGLLHLGTPSPVLRSCGVAVKELTLSPSVLHQHLKKHDLTTDDLKNLVMGLRNPMLVYVHGLNVPNMVAVTSFETPKGKLSIALRLDNNGQVVEMNNVSSIHGKDVNTEIDRLYEMGKDLGSALKYVDKEKVSDWLMSSPYKEAGTPNHQKLLSVAKIVNDFENPVIKDEKFSREGEDGSIKDAPTTAAEAGKAERAEIERKAKEDGTWMKAPNGQESNLSEDQWVAVRTKQFKDWFGDWEEDPEESSQAVDENGEPKVFYHNTDNDFTVFDANRNGTHTDAGWLGDGFYFYGDENEGDSYGHKKMEVFLNVRNMYYATSTENEELANANDREKSIAFRNEIEDEGYDGVYYNGDLRQEAVVFYPEQIKSATDNVGTYDAANPDIRYEKRTDSGYREHRSDSMEDVEAVNKRFNEELDAYSNQQMTKNDMLHLGIPSGVLAHFLPNLPIVMRQRILTKASVRKHNVDPLALKDMPKMMSHPIFIFQRADNAIGILTEMKDRDGKNVCVAIDLDREIQDGGETLNVNDIRSIHGREISDIVYPILKNGTLKWVDKKKGLAYLSSASHYVQQEIDKQNLSSVAKIVENFENPVIKSKKILDGMEKNENDVPTTPSEAEEGDVLYREVDDEEAARLDKEPTVKVYRAMQQHDGKLYPPMSGRVKTQVKTKKGTMRTKWEWRSPIEIGKWEQSEEHPEMANEDGTFTLDKGNGSKINAAYNPYIHTSRTPINDQFSSAWNRPELVTVEVEVPESELTSGYHAEKAKDATGEVEWKSGPVGREMAAQGKPRMVVLSRWDKPVRIVPVEEVAEEYAKRLQGTGITVPFNTVPPALREALVARGVEISEPEEGNAGQASRPSYEEWLRGDRREREGESSYTDEELSLMNDPMAKMLGENHRTAKQRRAFAARERRNMETAVRELAEKLHLDNVEIVTEPMAIKDKRGKVHHPKGYFDKATGKIVVCIGNNKNAWDVVQTVLHEAVGHYGLRRLFGKHFDTFLENVYAAADMDVRRKIAELAIRKYGGNFHVATEEYLATLAEDTNFDSLSKGFWPRIKQLFLRMIRAIGLEGFADRGVTLSDNELRYILWRSYKNLTAPGEYRSFAEEAEDVAKQAELKVGDFRLDEAIDQGASPEQVAVINRIVQIHWLTKKAIETFRQLMGTKRDLEKATKENATTEKTNKLRGQLAKLNETMDDNRDWAEDLDVDLRQLLKDNGIKEEDLREFDGMSAGEAQEAAVVQRHTEPKPEVAEGKNVSEPAAWGKKDMLSKAEQISHGIEPDLLFRDTIEDDDNTARETYNRMANRARETFREAWQDSMINVRRLQESVLKQRGEKMEDWEDAYNEENRSHGHAQDLDEYFDRTLYKPLLKAVNAVAKAAKVSIGDVTEYMMAKHGLERNEVFAARDAQAAWEKYKERKQGEYFEYQTTHPNSNKTLGDFMDKSYDDFYNHYREKDYSGLTALTGTDNVQDAEAEAQRIVAGMEGRNGVAPYTTKIWKATNDATGWTLKKAYESGIISKDNYEQVSRMFDYYIPLRGWKENAAEDLYDYVGGGNKGNAFSPTLHKAKGRNSEADNPIAYISSMAVSAIEQGRKNLVKQSFMRFVKNHPTNLVTVSEMWYRNYGTEQNPDWREDVPDIKEDATADEIADIVKQHEDDMKQLEAQGLATKERGRLHLGVPVKQGQALEHHVEVMVNGKKYVLYINGNPRAAQALNGTRQRRASDHGVTRMLLGIADNFSNMKNRLGKTMAWVLRGLATMQRAMSAFFTSKNPAFMLGNAFRDVDMALASTIIDEPIKYAHLFRMNMLRLGGPIGMIRLMHWYNKEGAGMEFTDMKNMKTMQRYFYEFVKGGGRTGFTSLRDIDDYKKELAVKFKDLKRSKLSPVLLFKDLADCFEYCNRAVEDMTRFATFVAARQYGKSVRESVSDAKNITLNFNRKGSGEMGNVQVRDLIIFVNPSIQALDRIVSMARRHPVKFSAYTAYRVLAGMGTPYITMLLWNVFGGDGGDDDDNWDAVDEYWKLPTWTRRNNLVFWIPTTKKFAMIPLAQEMRVANGFGEALTSELTGHSNESTMLTLASGLAGLLPIDFEGNGGNPLITLAPTAIQPLSQVKFNTDFTGRPIYKDNDFNKYEPSFQKAYIGTPKELISLSAKINELTGGNDHKQGWWERTKVGGELNNPAVVNHLLKGYFGGMYSILAQTGGLLWNAYLGETPDVQEVPIANRLVTAVRETQQNGKTKLPDWYYEMSDDSKRYQSEVSGYRRDMLANEPGAKQHFDAMTKTQEFKMQAQIQAIMNNVNQIRAAQPTVEEPQTEEEAQTKQELAEGLQTCLRLLDKIHKEGRPLTDKEMGE